LWRPPTQLVYLGLYAADHTQVGRSYRGRIAVES